MERPDLQVDDDGWVVGPFPVWGRARRYLVLAKLIRSGRALSVADLVDRLRRQDLVLPPRPNKAASDAIRWEVRKGRVVKVRWGVYRIGVVPRSTGYWILAKAEQHRRVHLAESA
ncbi:MAG: hypothetical protein OES24_23865 [Acidimicrobiia bacterium]|nr:hypothetical protein [Acidimicrobiia bacterium]